MKRTKFIRLFSTLLVFMTLFSTFAFATDSPPTGTATEICNLTFRVGYLGDSFKGNIAVFFKDIASDKEYQFLLEKDKGFNASEIYGVVANTTYKVTLSFADMDKFEIVNADGSKIDSYHATSSGLNLIWQIKDIKADTSDNSDTHGEDETTSVSSADDALNSFINKTKFIASDNNYKVFLGNWSGATYKKLYLEIEGNTEESWNDLTVYERATYSLLFTAPKSRMLGGNSNTNANDRNAFLNGLQFAQQDLNNITGGHVVYDAIVEVWDWHWKNWETQRTFVNLFEGNSYDDSDVVLNSDELDLTDEEIEEITSDLTSAERRSELSSRNNFLSIILNNIFTLIVLVVVGVVLLVVYLKNKKHNYEDYDE